MKIILIKVKNLHLTLSKKTFSGRSKTCNLDHCTSDKRKTKLEISLEFSTELKIRNIVLDEFCFILKVKKQVVKFSKDMTYGGREVGQLTRCIGGIVVGFGSFTIMMSCR